MPDLPKIEDLDATATSTSSTSGDPSLTTASDRVTSTAAPTVPPRGFPSAGAVAMVLALTGLVLYGTAGFLKEVGIYDVSRWWTKPPASPNLAAMTAAAPPPVKAAPFPASAAEGPSGPLRDQPPRAPSPNLPQFTVRDGEPHDFLTDLDTETLKRLAEVQGQLDGFVALMGPLNQAVRDLARNAGQQRQQEAAHQSQLHQELAAARREIAALQTTVGEVEARLKRAGSGSGRAAFGIGGTAAPDRRAPVAGWSVKAISGDRAWLRTPQGGEVTVTAGERLKALGAVRVVDAIQGIVVLADGRVVR